MNSHSYYRTVHDGLGVVMPLQLSTCVWHAKTCISEEHSSSSPSVTTPSLYSLCNECLAQSIKQPFRIMKPWEIPGVRLRVLNNTKSGGGGESINDESKDTMLVLGSSKRNGFQESQNTENTNKNEKQQLLDWNKIERGRPWFTPNRNEGGQDVTSIIPDAKGQAPRRHPPDGKRKALKPPRAVGGMHTFLNRYVQHYSCHFSSVRVVT